jgi:hypothetical protein
LCARLPRLSLLMVLSLPALAGADDVLHPGAVILDRPTPLTLGFQLLVTGDDDHDARVAVRHRVLGAPAWKTAMDAFRVRPEHVAGRVVPAQFAGSIFDLQPATTYEIELHATDPDGPVDTTVTTQATTRGLPADPQSPASKSVGDAGGFQAALDDAQPGDVITLAEGLYPGPFTIAASGTAANPIVVRGADQDGVVLDGRGCDCNLLQVDGSFVHVERLTLQNALRGLRFKTAGTEGNVARRIRIRDVTIGLIGDPDQRDFYLCDNVLEGRLAWPLVYADDGGRHASDDGVNVQGSGHVVCQNRIGGFGDALKVEQPGARAVDFYGNEVVSAYDNGVELDGSEGNARAFRNRFTNTFVPLSFQPVFGGPAYALRNVVVNVAEDQLKLYAQPSGVLVLHNTFVSPVQTLLMGSAEPSHDVVLRNNLFVGPTPPGPAAVTWSGAVDGGTLDHDGWFPDGTFDFGPAGSWSGFAAMQAAGVFEAHGVLLTPGVFASGLVAPGTFRTTMAPQDTTLASGSNAVDAGLALPNVNDGSTGAGPDLGALETGCPLPLFGVRPAGIDETNAPYGCGGPTVTTTTLPYVTIQTTAFKLKDKGPTARRVVFKSSTTRDPAAHRIMPPAAGGPGDPTIAGAVLTVYNAAGSGQAVTVPLPAAGWSPAGTAGYAFRSPDAGSGVSGVTVQVDRLRVKGGGAGWTYVLADPPERRVALRLTLGSERPWCAAALARVSGNPSSTARSDTLGLFVAQRKLAAPLVCPPAP